MDLPHYNIRPDDPTHGRSVLCAVMQIKEEKKKESNKRQEQRALTQEMLVKVQKPAEKVHETDLLT